jgi:hypothetical protein
MNAHDRATHFAQQASEAAAEATRLALNHDHDRQQGQEQRPVLTFNDYAINQAQAEADPDILGLPALVWNDKAQGSNADAVGNPRDIMHGGAWRGEGYRDYYAPTGAGRGTHYGESEPRSEFPIDGEWAEGDDQATDLESTHSDYGEMRHANSALDLLPVPGEDYGEEPTDENLGHVEGITSKAMRSGKAMGVGRPNRRPREDGRGINPGRDAGPSMMGQEVDDHTRGYYGRNAYHPVHNFAGTVGPDGLPLPQTFDAAHYRR